MDSQVLLIVGAAVVVLGVVAVGTIVALFAVFRGLGSRRGNEYEDARGRSDPRRPTNPDTTMGPSNWNSVSPPLASDLQGQMPPIGDSHQVSMSVINREYQKLDEAGYKPQLTKLPASSGEQPSYCFRTTGTLARKDRTAIVYLVCSGGFPFVPPDVYAEVLSTSDLDAYGQVKSEEVTVKPLRSIRTWDQASSSLPDVVREVLDQLGDSYRTTDKLSVFFNKYGELIRPHDDQSSSQMPDDLL